jgi:hypothetical protein
MGKKSSSSIISLPMIIGLIFAWNFIFDDDDEKDVNVTVEEEAPIISEDTKKELKKSVSEAINAAKEALKEVKSEIEKEFKTEEVEVDETQDIQPEEKKVVEKEEELETIEPMEEEKEKPKSGIGMKKL